MNDALAGRVVAITGGARGIGYATAQRLIADGARVAIGDIDEQRLKEAAHELDITTYAQLDVTSPDSFAAFLDLVEDELGPLDVLVNNAGIMPIGQLHQESDKVTRRMVEINVLGVIYGSKLALNRMLPRGSGHVINIASLAGEMSVPGLATYCGTKHAVNGFTESARMEYRGTGVHFSQVLPTFTNTELIAGTGKARGLRNAEPEEIAAAVAELVARPQPKVRVTRLAGVASQISKLLPARFVELLGHALHADTAFLGDVDASSRKVYDARLQTLIDDAEH